MLTGEKGFIDFLADIEEEIDIIINTVANMTSDLSKVTEGTSKSTQEINRVNVKGAGSASFMRKEAEKVAKLIANFA